MVSSECCWVEFSCGVGMFACLRRTKSMLSLMETLSLFPPERSLHHTLPATDQADSTSALFDRSHWSFLLRRVASPKIEKVVPLSIFLLAKMKSAFSLRKNRRRIVWFEFLTGPILWAVSMSLG